MMQVVEFDAIVGGAVATLLFILLLCFCSIWFAMKTPAEKITGDDLKALESSLRFSGYKSSGMLMFSGDLEVGSHVGSGDMKFGPFPVDKCVEFSFEELVTATNDFHSSNKIGEGGFGVVYQGILRGQRVAVKSMSLESTREFMAELQVLTHVHHTNLVQLIGYCRVDSLFLIYEFVENGTLDKHLHAHNNLPPLSWVARLQIALDVARGLEYIHEGTKPAYIHRDVKSNNILIDLQLHAKLADFGLTKMTKVTRRTNSRSESFSRLVGSYGYMSPEYAKYGDVSPKVDVYAFGVVLYEIISAREAVVRKSGFGSYPQASPEAKERELVPLFEQVLRNPEGKGELEKLVDPALEGHYPLESAWRMVQLAGACTRENPELRPSMRTAVVALMTLSSTTQSDWETSYIWNTELRLSFGTE